MCGPLVMDNWPRIGPGAGPNEGTMYECVVWPCFFFFFFQKYGLTRPNPARTRLMCGLCGPGQIDPDLSGLNFK